MSTIINSTCAKCDELFDAQRSEFECERCGALYCANCGRQEVNECGYCEPVEVAR